MKYRPGLEMLWMEPSYRRGLKGKRIGLITNQTGLTTDLKGNIPLIYEDPHLDLQAIFSPEHGLFGEGQDRIRIDHTEDRRRGVPVYSLYSNVTEPTLSMLQSIDVLLFDIQDIGLRYYTYYTTLLYTMESCAIYNKELMVLDRLNPLGRKVEGRILHDGFTSFEGSASLPHRHGMTLGEIALWRKAQSSLDLDLTIIKLQGWQGEYFDVFDLPWIPPSPNLPQFTTLLHYPMTVYIEGTNLSEGRGTANPFQYIGAPWIDGEELSQALRSLNLEGVTFRPILFTPFFSKHKGKRCEGVHVILLDRERVDALLVALYLLKTLFHMYPEEMRWIQYDGDDRFFLDLLMGTDEVRLGLIDGIQPEEILSSGRSSLQDFMAERGESLLY